MPKFKQGEFMEKNKIDKLQQRSQGKSTPLSPQPELQTVETYNYSKQNIQAILELLNNLQVKGIENIKAVASISYILEQPIDEGISEIKHDTPN